MIHMNPYVICKSTSELEGNALTTRCPSWILWYLINNHSWKPYLETFGSPLRKSPVGAATDIPPPRRRARRALRSWRGISRATGPARGLSFKVDPGDPLNLH